MTRKELENNLDVVVIETTSLIRKDRDRLVSALADFLVDDLSVEIDEEEEEPEEE